MPHKITYMPPVYQVQAWPDTYITHSFAPDFETRKQAFFEQVLRDSTPVRDSKQAIFEVARLAAGGRADESVIHKSLTDFIEGRKDCADFVMQAVERLLYQVEKNNCSGALVMVMRHSILMNLTSGSQKAQILIKK